MSLDQIRCVRRKLAEEGSPRVRQAGDFVKVALPAREGDLLRDLLIAEKVATVVEIGLAYASSALAIGEALIVVGARAPRHLIIDPFQESAFANAGWELLEAAALHPTTRLIREPSSVALPQLVAEAVAADAAFIDGSHRFHEVFVDLYFLRKIVRPGGLVVVDDYDWPSVQTAVRYFEINMGWRSLDDTFAAGSTAAGSIDETKSIPRLRALRLPDPPFETPFELFKPF